MDTDTSIRKMMMARFPSAKSQPFLGIFAELAFPSTSVSYKDVTYIFNGRLDYGPACVDGAWAGKSVPASCDSSGGELSCALFL